MRDYSRPSVICSIDLQRIGEGIATLGGSEIYRGVTGGDPLDDATGLLKDATGHGGQIPGQPSPADYRMVWDQAQQRWRPVSEMIAQAGTDLQGDRQFVQNFGGTEPIRNTTPITPRDIPYEDVAQPGDVHATLPGDVHAYNPSRIQSAGDVNAPTFAPVSRVNGVGYTAEDIAPMTRIGPTTVGRAAIDTGSANQMKGAEAGSIADLQSAAAGRAPSAAEKLLKGAMAQSSQDQLAIASGARGAQRAGALREATIAAGEGAFKAAQTGAATRAAEMATARGQLSGAISQARGADIELASHAADLAQQADSLQGQIDAARARGDADAANQLALQQAQMRNQARQFTAGNEQRAGEANAAAENARAADEGKYRYLADTGNVERQQGINTHQADLDTAAMRDLTTTQNERDVHNSDLLTGVAERNLDRGTGVQVGNANRRGTVDISAAGNDLEAQKATQSLGVERDIAEANRKRGDFNAGVDARTGLRGTQTQLIGVSAQQAANMTNEQLAILAAQGDSAATAELSRRNAQQGALALGSKVFGAVTGAPPIGPPANFGPNNAPSIYGGNTVEF